MTKGYEYNKRWREKHPDARLRAKKRNYAQTQGAPRSRQLWTSADDQTLLDWEGTDRELSHHLGRSVQAIQIRRVRLTKEVAW